MAKKEAFVRVVGLTFRKGNYPQNLHRLSEVMTQEQAEGIRLGILEPEELTVLLVREPDNPADPNAIQVHVPALGRMGWVGFIPKDIAKRLAFRMDNGHLVQAWVSAVPIDPNHLDKPGLEIRVLCHALGCDLPNGVCICDTLPRDWSEPQ